MDLRIVSKRRVEISAIAVLEAELNAMRNSKVWRWSAPARKVVGKIRRSIKK